FRYIEVERSERALAIAVWKELRARNYDLVHSHGFTAGILSSLPANLCRVPHIMTAHDVMLDWQYRGARGRAKLYGAGFFFRRINVVMAVGEDARNNLAQVFPWLKNKNRLTAVRNGID